MKFVRKHIETSLLQETFLKLDPKATVEGIPYTRRFPISYPVRTFVTENNQAEQLMILQYHVSTQTRMVIKVLFFQCL